MKSRNREINIFSMSALDLFASALGAFILISIALFPYFPNTGNSPEDIAALREALAEAQQQLQQCQSELDQTRGELAEAQRQLDRMQGQLDRMRDELQSCQDELRKKFLLVLISWGTKDDVDLHVVDPAGNEFYYERRSHSGTPAKFEEDNIRGPGNEIWLHPQATPGEYKLYYKLFSKRERGGVRVRGAILTPEGRQSAPTIRLTRENEKPLVAIVTVDNDGNARLRAAQ